MNFFYSPSLRQFVKSLTDLRQAGMPVFSGPIESLTIAFVADGGGALALTEAVGVFGISKRSDITSTLALSTTWTLAENNQSATASLEVDTIETRVALDSGPINTFVDCLAQFGLGHSGQPAVNSNFLYCRILNSVVRPEGEPPSVSTMVLWAWLKNAIAAGTGLTKTADDTAHTLSLAITDPAILASQLDTDSAFTTNSDLKVPSQKAVKTALATEAATRANADSANAAAISAETSARTTAVAAKLNSSARGAANGVAPLDSTSKVPAANLPSYVDDVLEFANLAAMPNPGETGKICVALDSNRTYRWSGSAYVEVSATPAFANQTEAEAGADNTKLMTPLRTAEAIAANAYSLPAPGVSTLGGVMRNVGSGNQFVNGVDSNGALLYAAPVLPPSVRFVQVHAQLSGYTQDPTPATPPPDLVIQVYNSGSNGFFYINATGLPQLNFTVAGSDPGDGSCWLFQDGGGMSQYGSSLQICNYINSNWTDGSVTPVWNGIDRVTLRAIPTGSSQSISGTSASSAVNVSGGGNGTDAQPGVGKRAYAFMLQPQEGFKHQLLSIEVNSNIRGNHIGAQDLFDGTLFITGMNDTENATVRYPKLVTEMDAWVRGCLGGLVVYIVEDAIVDGNSADVFIDALLIPVEKANIFIDYVCQGSDKYARYTNGSGGFTLTLVESNSNSCGYTP